MKKQLLASTALVTAGMFAFDGANAQTVKLGLGGYMQQEFGVTFDRQASQAGGAGITSAPPQASAVSFDVQQDVEVYFIGSGKLDNGIEVGARVELEVAGSPGNMIDEEYLFLRGSFGQLEIGVTDNVGIKMTIGYMGSWATQVGLNSAFTRTNWIATVGGVAGGNNGSLRNSQLDNLDNDSQKINYYTPRFEGFQLGVSYIPNFAQNVQSGSGASEIIGAPQSTSIVTVNPVGKSVYHEGFVLGANFDRKFDELGVGIAGSYMTAKSPGTVANQAGANWQNTEDVQGYTVGASLEWGPFKVAFGYREAVDARDSGSLGVTAATSLDGRLYDVGARYTFGPNAISLTYTDGKVDGATTPGEDTEKSWQLSFRRTLGPGVNWHSNLLYMKSENETGEGVAGVRENDGWALVTAILLTF